MKLLFTIFALAISTLNFSQNSSDTVGLAATKKNVLLWADTVFSEYKDVYFKEYNITYSDEYEMAMMRKSALDKTKIRLKYSFDKGTLTKEEFERENKMVADKEIQIEKEMETTDLISNLSILFCANFSTNNGNKVYAEYVVSVSTKGKIATSERKTLIGIYDGDEVRLKALDISSDQ